MDRETVQKEIDELESSGNLNGAKRNKLAQLRQWMEKNPESGIQEVEEEVTEEVSTSDNDGDGTAEDKKKQALYKLEVAEAAYTGVQVNSELEPTFQKFLDSLDPDNINDKNKGSEFITIRIHKHHKEKLDDIVTRVNAFNERNISHIQALECIINEWQIKNKKKLDTLKDKYIEKLRQSDI